MTSPFDRQAACPSCGAPITFRFAGAAAQVCKHCNFVVARTDRNLVAVGRMADLVDIPSPLQLGGTGRWSGGEPFMVDGRVQLDRASAPGAPWQEFFITFPTSGKWCWVASAQGRWYSTSEVPLPPELPPIHALRAGQQINLGSYGVWTVAEVGQRRVVSGEGEMPHVAAPGVPTGYADIAAPNGAFGTIDYGDGRNIPPKLYLGRQIDPSVMVLDSGAPVEAAKAEVTSVACPNCGGNLPLVTPGQTERIVCRYCGMASDLQQGALRALGPAPKPPIEPFIPLGAEGNLRGNRVICIGFTIRGCTVEGERYRWREYLLYAGPRVGYLWLMEEDGAWWLVTPIPPGEVSVSGGAAMFRSQHYNWKQSVRAETEYVVGEFYWKVEVGEAVQATEYEGSGGKVSVEQTAKEVNYSFCERLSSGDIGAAFGIKPPAGSMLASGEGGSGCASSGCGTMIIIGVVILFVLLIVFSDCGSGGGGGGVFIGGPSFGGGK
ncbi:DUF4178 domain-containing protein [Polyangium sp. 6x1]|uniref:DUF4178 domain-containing protein n=1 Tax=Polyangium sp. 6x1 TaxID=3042689 RepID=UPI0024822A42|nr:DUF4178 domain-containing protein [Polyangium sp. 6x1]MDI1450320.1 DUF4178 domain-containing protein [Polyangium sp. 6x1]